MKTIYFAYNKRSCLTGRELFDTLKESLRGVANVRRISAKGKKFLKKPDLLIRWGNSYTNSIDGCLDIQPKEAVELACNKGYMMDVLSSNDKIPTPNVFLFNSDGDGWKEMLDSDGKAFFRNNSDQVRYRSNPVDGDRYVSQPIDKTREFRVHVFDGKTLGVYEKVPNTEDSTILKNDNSDFVRLDMSNDNARKSVKGVRPAAKEAVESLGLLFGGVDVVVDAEGNPYVLEVNSSPSLNEPNLIRWTESFIDYISKI